MGCQPRRKATLPSWAQQGQKEIGLRRGVPTMGSTSKNEPWVGKRGAERGVEAEKAVCMRKG